MFLRRVYICISMGMQTDILSLAYKQPFLYNQLEVLQDVVRNVPGSVQYSIKRYKKDPQWNLEDTGVLVYNYVKNNPAENYLELKFCVTGNVYCRLKESECDSCKLNASRGCIEKVDSVDVLSFTFTPSYLHQFAKAHKTPVTLTDNVLSFEHTASFSKILPLCGKTRMAIEALLNHTYTDTLEIFSLTPTRRSCYFIAQDLYVGR